MKDFQGWIGGWGKEKGESQASLAWAWAQLGNKLSQDSPGQVGGWLGQKSFKNLQHKLVLG